MSIAFYKSEDPDLISTLMKHQEESKRISALGFDFAKKFGGHAVYFNDLRGFRLVDGIRFEPDSPERHSRVWTRPNKNLSWIQAPKKSVTKATPEEKAEMERLAEMWKDFPRDQASYEPVLTALGLRYEDFFFSKFQLFVVDDKIVYVSAGAHLKVAPILKEILGSEFSAEYEKHQAVKREAENAKLEAERQAI
jgi:hypothetical protein